MNLVHGKSAFEISQLLCLSERTIQRYLTLFRQTGDVKPLEHRNGPQKLLSDFEQCELLSLILQNPGIYLHEIQDKLYEAFGVLVSAATICRTLQFMGCTRQVIRSVAIQQSDAMRAKFMAEISIYDPSMFLWLDESGCDRRNTLRKYGYSIRGIHPVDNRLLVRVTRYSALPIMSITGLHDLYLAEGTMNGDRFTHFISTCLLPVLMPYNGMNQHSIVIMDNASIHHVDEVLQIIENAGAKVIFLPPYSPDLNPLEPVFGKVKAILKKMIKFFKHVPPPGHFLQWHLE